jgi:GH15 family glucan-1,4-alpha-glucosidase
MNQNLDLAVIGNCQVSALIDDMARIVWMCLPRPDADPAFCRLLGGDWPASKGAFSVELAGATASTRRYLPNTAILETVLTDGNGNSVRVTDFCPRFRARERMFKPVGLVRIIEAVSGRPMVRLRVEPASDRGCARPEMTWGSSHIRFTGGDYPYRITTDASVQSIIEQREFVLDRPLTVILGPDEPLSESVKRIGRQFVEDTAEYWRDWVRGLAIPFEWQDEVIRAAITLKLCTYEDTGAVLAALTTSIPESAGSARNWDYRYCTGLEPPARWSPTSISWITWWPGRVPLVFSPCTESLARHW